jgi:hypothetical protein
MTIVHTSSLQLLQKSYMESASLYVHTTYYYSRLECSILNISILDICIITGIFFTVLRLVSTT